MLVILGFTVILMLFFLLWKKLEKDSRRKEGFSVSRCFDCENQVGYRGNPTRCFDCEREVGYRGNPARSFDAEAEWAAMSAF